ncbi:MAG TPA: glutamate--cysteine ligase [Pseudobdellovibrionaceae bacterium]|nr:glutamate--cysteine ligase [Pseudobdellovibrionaceae bacterium]
MNITKSESTMGTANWSGRVSTAQNDLLHHAIVRHHDKLMEWYQSQRHAAVLPFYSSFDIRDSGFKVANVDGNIYPAGFNNICPTDRESAPEAVRYYLDRHYRGRDGGPVRRLLLITEEHTNNPYYWENVHRLVEILRAADLEVKIGIPRLKEGVKEMQSASGFIVQVTRAEFEGGEIRCCGVDSGFFPDLVVSNNDFSEFYSEWGESLQMPLNPPRELGWWQRKKSNYFRHYNRLATEFAHIIQVDPWLLTVETELFENFDLSDDKSRESLAQRTQQMLDRLRVKNREHGVQDDPFLFVKNNSGTYGLGVMRVSSGEEILQLNYKTRKKMKAAKGGREVEEVILQEGIPSIVRADDVTAEPTIYMVGCQLIGGFLRSHSEKGPTESLNSPGAVYKRLCVSDLKISIEGHPLENVYGSVARLGVLAIGAEAEEMRVEYRGYIRDAAGGPQVGCGN